MALGMARPSGQVGGSMGSEFPSQKKSDLQGDLYLFSLPPPLLLALPTLDPRRLFWR